MRPTEWKTTAASGNEHDVAHLRSGVGDDRGEHHHRGQEVARRTKNQSPHSRSEQAGALGDADPEQSHEHGAQRRERGEVGHQPGADAAHALGVEQADGTNHAVFGPAAGAFRSRIVDLPLEEAGNAGQQQHADADQREQCDRMRQEIAEPLDDIEEENCANRPRRGRSALPPRGDSWLLIADTVLDSLSLCCQALVEMFDSRFRLVVTTSALLGALITIGVPQLPGQAQTTSPSAQLQALIDEVNERRADAMTAENRLPPSFEELDREAFWAHSIIERADAIERDSLSHLERQTLEIVRWNAWVETQSPRLYWYYSPLMPSRSPLRSVRERAQRTVVTDGDSSAAYLERVAGAGAVLDALHQQVRGRLERGIVLPAEQIDRVLPLVRSFAAAAEQHPLWLDSERLSELEPDDAERVQERLRELIGTEVAPRAAALAHYVDSTVRRHAPDAVGWWQYPGGKEAYRIATRIQTTLDVTPEQVHQIGLDGVAELNRQMALIRTELGWQGTKAQFHDHLREDERFYVSTPDEFGERLLEFDARILPLIDRQFGKKPEAPHSVRRLDPALEATMTYGFFSVPTEREPTGYYNFNGSELRSRSLLSGAALTYHELVPGHHFQIALQRENEELPTFRRFGYFAGYGEGWGEYSSSVVARELGMYEDPYDLYGRLVFDMFFCVRLVVDTGMNYLGWSRQRAMDYMAEHTMESAVQIDSETIRYSMRQPAQALAYRMGRETWVRLRAKAESELGDKFDVRRFHDSVLGIGSVPLFVLEEHVDWLIEQERKL